MSLEWLHFQLHWLSRLVRVILISPPTHTQFCQVPKLVRAENVMWSFQQGRGKRRRGVTDNLLLTHGKWVLNGYISQLHWLSHLVRVVLIPQIHTLFCQVPILMRVEIFTWSFQQGRRRKRRRRVTNYLLLTHYKWVLNGYISQLHWLSHLMCVVLIPQTHTHYFVKFRN